MYLYEESLQSRLGHVSFHSHGVQDSFATCNEQSATNVVSDEILANGQWISVSPLIVLATLEGELSTALCVVVRLVAHMDPVVGSTTRIQCARWMVKRRMR